MFCSLLPLSDRLWGPQWIKLLEREPDNSWRGAWTEGPSHIRIYFCCTRARSNMCSLFIDLPDVSCPAACYVTTWSKVTLTETAFRYILTLTGSPLRAFKIIQRMILCLHGTHLRMHFRFLSQFQLATKAYGAVDPHTRLLLMHMVGS
jgi:hypothetical protein